MAIPPKITIITAVYQGASAIEGCIRSVIDQGYDALEHIIIDGGSSDGTVDIIQRFADKYPHIRFISEKDSGQSEALNKGIRMANAPIIGILNVDDFYEPNVLKRIDVLVAQLKEPSLLVGNCNLRGVNDVITGINAPKRLRLRDLLLGWSINPFPVNPSAYFYHRSLHEKIGYYNEKDHFSMDVHFLFKAVKVANVRYFNEVWGNFRFIPGTKTYEDVKNGTNKKRVAVIYSSYIEELPLLSRIWVKLMRLGKTAYFYYRLEHYLKHPRDIGRVIGKIFANP